MIVLAAFAFSPRCHAATLGSPDGNVQVKVQVVDDDGGSKVVYDVAYLGRPVLAASSIRFERGDGVIIGDDIKVASEHPTTQHRSSWRPLYGERSVIEDNYNQLKLKLDDSSANCSLVLTFRCYDHGVAFKTTFESCDARPSILLNKERCEFRFLDDHNAWCAATAQGVCQKMRISEIKTAVERPLVMQASKNAFVAIAEAKLVEYARMKPRRSTKTPHCIISQLSGGVQSPLPLETPWRVIMLGESPGDLLENNDILLNLNDPSAIADASWIKPGKVIRDITLTNHGAKACIDFAAENRFSYVEFDAGWYGHEYDDASDATTITLDLERSKGPFDLRELIDYANQRGIGVIVYVNRRALERQLDELLPLYKSWGVAGVKYGFVNVGSQEWTSWLHEAIRKAAEHELMVDVHDEYRPTGFSRTYPNLMTQEGVRGDEASPTAEQAMMTLFTRGLAGASDHTICYFDERVTELWTHGHQLAKSVCSYSPWQFVFWYDTPLPEGRGRFGTNAILKTEELEFFRRVPTTWDDTIVLAGEIGEYAVIARRSGAEWFVGAMNSGKPREVRVPLYFLGKDKRFAAQIYRDDPSAPGPTHIGVVKQDVDSTTTWDLLLRRNGGQAMILTPVAGGKAGAALTSQSNGLGSQETDRRR